MHSIQSRAIRIDQHGGPEQLKLVTVSVGDPGPGEIRIRHKAVGLNFIDVYQRSGLYPSPMPLQLGMEASGVVEAVGEGVSHLQPGDRAAYASQPPGSYCDVRVMPAKTVCKLPEAIDFDTGAAMMLKGLTAQYLLKKARPVEGLEPGEFVVTQEIGEPESVDSPEAAATVVGFTPKSLPNRGELIRTYVMEGGAGHLIVDLAGARAIVEAAGADPLLLPDSLGIFFGLVLGKPLGIALFSGAAIALGWCALPEGTRFTQIIGVGCLAGIGFTMSIFITLLAFDDPAIVVSAKTAILASSLVAALMGAVWLRRTTGPSQPAGG